MTHKTTITDNYILITSDEEIKEGNYIFSTKSNNIFKADSIEYLEKHNLIEDFDKSFYISSIVSKKIIAHLPLNNAPQLEGVTLLPPLPSGEEKYRFTEEDMIQAFAYGRTLEPFDNFEDFIQSLSQPKMPTSFSPNMVCDQCNGDESTDSCYCHHGSYKIVPQIINGVMQGEWIY